MDTLDRLLEEVTVKPVEPKDETQTPEATATPGNTPEEKPITPPEPAQVNEWEILGKHLGREFKGEEDFETFKSSLTTTESQIKEYQTREQQWAAEKEELAKGVDPMSYFASPELFVLNGLLKQFPDKNPLALTEISTKDFSKSYLETPVDVLALDLMLEHPGIYANKAEAMEDVYARYSIDDPEEIDAKAKRRMQVDAKTAIDKFADIKGKITPPKPVDLTAERAAKQKATEERIAKMTEATEALFKTTIPKSLQAVEIPVTIKGEDGKEVTEVAFKYNIPESYAKSKAVQEVIAQVRNATVQNEAEWTPAKEAKLKEDVTELLLGNYFYKNRTEIYAAIRDDLQTKFKDEAWMKKHNVRQLRTDAPDKAVDPKQAKIQQNQVDVAKSMGINI